jgi:quinolinate synthase
VLRLKDQYPSAIVVVHTECLPEVQELAQYVSGSDGIFNFVAGKIQENAPGPFLVGAEYGVIERLNTAFPSIDIMPLKTLVCGGMRTHGIDDLAAALNGTSAQIVLDHQTIAACQPALLRMLALS